MPTVAVIGASSERRKFGNKSVRAHLQAGYTVYPVHPRETSVEGQPAFPTIAAVPPGRLDRVTIYLPAGPCLAILPELAARDIGEVWFNPGADAPEVLAKARELGLPVVVGCSIVDLGMSPHTLPE